MTTAPCDLIYEKDMQNDSAIGSELAVQGLCVRVYDESEKERQNEIVIYSLKPLNLSDNMPILENLGLCIEREGAGQIHGKKDDVVYIKKYIVACLEHDNWKETKQNLADVIEGALLKRITNSPLNALAYLANLSVRQIRLIKAIAAYEDQLISVLSEQFIAKTLVRHATLTRIMAEYFLVKFDPEEGKRANKIKTLEEQIAAYVQGIENISEDRVVRIFNQILTAMTRTNYFLGYEHIAFKVDVTQLASELKGLQPKIETFVYHPDFCGVHLRRSLVSRGGLRYSDRHDDYRNEIKALMKAQRSKNSVIIPSGAKGGFIIRKEKPSKEDFVRVYETYINALLDLVDNRVDGQVVTPEKIVRYDGDDTYFVVAADKGTAAMSDVANAISEARGFWLGDAFASGGSKGFSHKDMGITAKGSIKSVERFFIEKGVNFYEESITVVGIGSPSGDVFGNGIQLSTKFALVAAIGSREIFIDPNPDLMVAFVERQRLFEAGLGWSHYNPELISKGGGIFNKDAKTITLSPEIKERFGIKKDVMDGPELTRTVLCAKVDMLFNGGVGTYVKASTESNSEIGDKPNESVRVDGREIKAYCVCEGGNLGFTQKARIEYARSGGRINMDAIDNSAGVNTSDIEVNLKIILNTLVTKGIIQDADRVELLHSLIPNVENTVLWTNYFQALAISLDEIRSRENPERFRQTIMVLEEKVENFERNNFEIPSNEEFESAVGKNGAIYRPILSIMLSYAKIYIESFLKQHGEFLDSHLSLQYVYHYFPKTFGTIYKNDVASHPLRRDIIANYIANKIINAQGASFIYDASLLGDEKFLLKIKSFLLVNSLLGGNDIRFDLFRHDYAVPVKKQYELLLGLDYTVQFSMEWLMEHGEESIGLRDHLQEYRTALADFIASVDEKYVKVYIEDSDRINRFFSLEDYIQLVMTIIKVKESTHQEFVPVANLFFTATTDLDIFFLVDTIRHLHAESEWEERLKHEMDKEIFEIVFEVIERIMKFRRENETIEEAYKVFVSINNERYKHYLADLKALKAGGLERYSAMAVVINSLKKIVSAAG